MRWSRTLGVGGFAVGVAAFVVAIVSALGAASPSGGVAGASVTVARSVTHSVEVAGVHVVITQRPNGGVCYSAPGIASCVAHVRADELSYAGSGQRVGGVAGAQVRAVIAKTTGKGTVWLQLQHGAFYGVLPRGLRLRAIVKVLPGGRHQRFAVH
jgi:hypothetical protein